MDLLTQAEKFAALTQDQFGEQLVSVVLFGSVARGDGSPASDIDLLIVLKTLPAGRFKRRDLLEPVMEKALQNGLKARFNCHLKTPEEAQKITVMYFDFPGDAKLLVDTNDFFKKIIERVAERIKVNGSVRKRWGKYYYWDLKPDAHADQIFEIL